MVWFDLNPSILRWNSEEIVVPYISPVDGNPHRYFVDFIIEYKTADNKIKKTLIEVKPDKQTRPPTPPKNGKTKRFLEEIMTYTVNQAKWKAAKLYAERNGIDFQILTENHIKV